jgi:hypothetical protein
MVLSFGNLPEFLEENGSLIKIIPELSVILGVSMHSEQDFYRAGTGGGRR